MSTTTAPARLGVLGGSFNPVHNGHLRMAVEALEQLGLDRVDLVPAASPPHKPDTGMLDFGERLRLVELAVADVEGLGANPLEGHRPGPSFTCDTLHCMRTEQPHDEFHFILGTGTFLELGKWKQGLELPNLANLVVVNRWEQAVTEVADFLAEHWPEAEPQGHGVWRFASGSTLTMLDMPRLDIKAGDIRRRWRERRRLDFLVPEAVRLALEKGGEEYEAAWGARASRSGEEAEP